MKSVNRIIWTAPEHALFEIMLMRLDKDVYRKSGRMLVDYIRIPLINIRDVTKQQLL